MPTLDAVAHDLREQWDLLRAWLEQLPDAASEQPSTLPGWSIGVLVAHLGRVLSSTAAMTLDETDERPLSIDDLLTGYGSHDPDRVDANARAYAAEIADDPLARLDVLADTAFAHVDLLAEHATDTTAIRTRHGDRIGLVDYLLTRVVELVVHAYDLAPALGAPAPVDPTARTFVSDVLLEVLHERTGYQLDVVDQEAWIKAATGRLTWPAAVERGAVRPAAASDGTPDLTRSLPLL